MTTPEYCTISDLRNEGFTDPPYSDARVTEAIQLASAAIDRVTGWWFEPRSRTIKLDGRGTRFLRFGFPIISITSIEIDGTEVDTDSYIVYNRHLSGLEDPDDRNMPKVELKRELSLSAGFTLTTPVVWPKGQQNIEIDGFFGYTDYDEGVTAEGITPLGIRRLCILLAIPELDQLVDPDAGGDYVHRYRLTEIRTRDQAFKFGGTTTPMSSLARDGLTGDPRIDRLILYYRRPSKIGAV